MHANSRYPLPRRQMDVWHHLISDIQSGNILSVELDTNFSKQQVAETKHVESAAYQVGYRVKFGTYNKNLIKLNNEIQIIGQFTSYRLNWNRTWQPRVKGIVASRSNFRRFIS